MSFSGTATESCIFRRWKNVLTAKMRNGLYIVSHISKGFEETARPSMEIDSITPETSHAKLYNDNEETSGESATSDTKAKTL